MALQNGAPHPRKRRRRRRPDRPAVSARLLLNDRIKGEVGVLSEDLFSDLFPWATHDGDSSSAAPPPTRYVAITPWLPSAIVASQSVSWTILPVRPATKDEAPATRPHSSLQVSASSLALQTFSQALHNILPNKTQRKDTPIEIRIHDVVPVGLETVFVNLDTEALRKLDEVHAKFGGGFGGTRSNGTAKGPKDRFLKANGLAGKHANTVDYAAQEQAWRRAVREALQVSTVVHSGDLLPLPLPAHPITHLTPPPAKIAACEPVSQGILLPTTRIIVLQSHRGSKPLPMFAPVKPAPISNGGFGDEESEDTSNEQFYSAAEDRLSSQNNSRSGEESTDDLSSEMSGSDTGDLSDDSDDIISLNAPMLPPQSSGVLSSFSSATPRPGNFHTNGIATPGSVFSSFTATTARGPSSKSKVFKAHGLLHAIPEELIHPKPGGDDDEEARIFVDTTALVKVGCFSGDWVKIEVALEPSQHPLFGLGAFGPDHEDGAEWRPARVYGVPEAMTKKVARYALYKSDDFDRRSSFSGFGPTNTPLQAYLSPVLLANMGSPSHLRITTLAPHQSSHLPRSAIQKPRFTSSSLPPSAKEVTLLKLSTPLSSDRLVQPSLFASLKEHFEQKRRLVKTGDLIGVAIDESLGRAVFQANEEDAGIDELLSKSKIDSDNDIANVPRNPQVVAWFKIGNVTTSSNEQKDGEETDIWGGVVAVDAASTKMEMNGSEQGKTPPPINSAWQYYLGAKRPPVGAAQKITTIEDLPSPYVSSLRRRLRELISVATSPRAIHLGLPPIAILLTSTQRGIGKSTVATRSCEDLGLHTFPIDAFDVLSEGGAGGGDVKTEGFLKARAERALTCGAEFTALLIKHIDALSADRMNAALKEILADSRVLIATTTEVDKVPEGIRGIFTHEIAMSAPDEGEREGILRSIVEDAGIRLSPDVDLANVAVKTAALVAGDLVDVVDRAMVAKRTRIEALAKSASKTSSSDSPVTTKDVELAGGYASNSLTKSDLDAAVDAARKNFADSIGAPKIPNVTWSDVGGLSHVKDAVMETIQLPLSRPELFAKGMKKRSGILFYGPPGTGKTLLAKAIATEFSLNFFSVKGPELLNMYIGESEANVRRVFQRARDARPCVVFFDELDSVAPKRGNQGDSGGVMDRIVSQLLAELDGMSDGGEGGGGGVFVIGATNRPDLLDQALLRPGRFDKMLYLGVSDTHEKQETILEALTRKFTLHPSLSLPRIASSLPFTYTGADMYALCSDAMLKAITRQARAVDDKVRAYNISRSSASPPLPPVSIAYFFDHLAEEGDTEVVVEERDFEEARRELVPSVSAEELRHYERVRRTFEGVGKKEEKRQEGMGRGINGEEKGKGKGKAIEERPVENPAGQEGFGNAVGDEELYE